MAGKGRVDPRIILERRRKVARLRLAGITDQRAIAAQLGVSRQTIGYDLKALDAEWRAEYLGDTQQHKAHALARLNALIAANWKEAMDGSTRHGRLVNELLARQAAIIGYDAPTKTTVSGEFEHYHYVEPSDAVKRVIEEAERIIGQD